MPANEYEAYARKVAERYGIDPDIFVAQIALESGNWNEDVLFGRRKGSSGEVGAGQFMPGTSSGLQKKWGWNFNPANPDEAIEAAGRYMSELQKQYGGDIEKALAAYNAGEGAVNEAIKKSYAVTGSTLGDLTFGAIGDRTKFGSGKDWQNYLPESTRSSYLSKIIQKDNNGNIITPSANYAGSRTSPGGRAPSPSGSSMVNPDGSLRMPNISDSIYQIEGENGATSIDYNAYFRDLNAYYQAENARRNMEYGPLSKYVDDVINDYAQQIESGKLSLDKARELTQNRISSFKTANDIYASDAFKYGAPTGATSINAPGFTSPIQGGINVNPLEFALNNIQTGDDMFNAVNVPQVPGLPQIMSGYQGQYGGSAPSPSSGGSQGYFNNNQGPAPDSNTQVNGATQAALSANAGYLQLGQMLAGQQPPPPPPAPPPEGASVGTYPTSNYDDLARMLAQGGY